MIEEKLYSLTKDFETKIENEIEIYDRWKEDINSPIIEVLPKEDLTELDVDFPIVIDELSGNLYQNLVKSGDTEITLKDRFDVAFEGNKLENITPVESIISVEELHGNSVANIELETIGGLGDYCEYDKGYEIETLVYNSDENSIYSEIHNKHEKSNDGLMYLNEVEGNTLQNLCTTGDKEVGLNRDLGVVESDNGYVILEDTSDGVVDVELKGKTEKTLISENTVITAISDIVSLNSPTPNVLVDIDEIHGNTYVNSLGENISVGKLLVDENNNPILDQDGNQQYVLEIVKHKYKLGINS